MNDFESLRFVQAAICTKYALGELLKNYQKNKVEPKSKLVNFTVKGDIYDIGKNLITMLIEITFTVLFPQIVLWLPAKLLGYLLA